MGICAQIFLVMALNRTTGMRVAVLGYLQVGSLPRGFNTGMLPSVF
jgi:hypothetical protein